MGLVSEGGALESKVDAWAGRRADPKPGAVMQLGRCGDPSAGSARRFLERGEAVLEDVGAQSGTSTLPGVRRRASAGGGPVERLERAGSCDRRGGAPPNI